MLFNSFEFLWFFGVVWILVVALRRSRRWMLLLPASYVFYMAWEPEYALLLVLSTAVDWVAGRRIHASERPRTRRAWLGLSLAVNLGVLFTFKYFGFFGQVVADAAALMGMEVAPFTLQVLLPVGISFYTFQTLSYTIDIHLGRLKPEPNLLRFALFVAFFPQLVAGPIERARHLLPQLRDPKAIAWKRTIRGLQLVIWGMFKKVVIADRIGPSVDVLFASPGDVPALPLLIGLYFFAIQIYCDFSGYSDIAIGIARMLGYDLMQNFRRPYFARSLGEFWHRWHISLSTWFRDYVYIPLGGSRSGHTDRNILIVFLVSGLWHGAAWTFVVWGALHGVYLVFERRARWWGRVPGPVRWFVTFHWVVLTWAFFRAASIQDAWTVVTRITTGLGDSLRAAATGAIGAQTYRPLGTSRQEFVLALGLIVLLFCANHVQEHLPRYRRRVPTRTWQLLQTIWFDALVLGILFLGVLNASAFIYFQF